MVVQALMLLVALVLEACRFALVRCWAPGPGLSALVVEAVVAPL